VAAVPNVVTQTAEAAPAPAPVAAQPSVPEQAAPKAPRDAVPAVSAAPAPAPAPAAAPAASPTAAVKVDVIAQQSVWISVRADGQYSFSGVLEPNQSRSVAASQNVLLKLGNAGGVSVVLNGKPLGPLGKDGDVRTLQLTSGGFKIVPPEAPKPAPSGDSPINPL
jgi:cytoskeleton protein RodZ